MNRSVSLVVVAALSAACAINSFGQQPKDLPIPAIPGVAQIDPAVEKPLRGMTDYYRRTKTMSAKVKSTLQIEAVGMKQEMAMSHSFAFERPNRVAMRFSESGVMPMGYTLVSDGKEVSAYVPMFKRYTRREAPEEMQELFNSPDLMMSAYQTGALFALLAENPYAAILDGVTKAKLIGTDKVDGVECDHLTFEQIGFDWDCWIERGEKPALRKVTLDIGKAVREHGPKEQQMQKMLSVTEFSDWKFDQPLTENFKFEPPAGVELSAAEPEGDEAPHMLSGKPAPALTLPLLGEGKVDLASHKGKDVVVLDFWATWCGPCVQGLPILAKVIDAYRGKGVVFYAVNQREDEATIRAFLKQKKLELTVPLDRDGKIGDAYGVEGIPQTVIIDKQGVVQAVHVGFSPDLKQRLTRELDALLQGKPLADAKASATPREMKGLEKVWETTGNFSGIAADGEIIYALSGAGQCTVFGADGKKQREFKSKLVRANLRMANLAGDKGRELIGFASWGPEVLAIDANGSELWKHAGGQGVDDVWAADLDGDGLDEVIIGYNGNTGLHVLNNQAKPVWSDTSIGNVWHVTAGNIAPGGNPEVITTSAGGVVHIFDSTGKKLKDLEPGLYANMVRFAPANGNQPAMVFAGGSGDDGEAMVAMDGNGKKLWETKLGGKNNHIDAALPAAGRPLLAVQLRGAGIMVIDTTNGKIIAELPGSKRGGDIVWLETKGGPLLVASSSAGLQAYRVSEP
jgi:thiol-disulfide isomerase/thioredoxin